MSPSGHDFHLSISIYVYLTRQEDASYTPIRNVRLGCPVHMRPPGLLMKDVDVKISRVLPLLKHSVVVITVSSPVFLHH